MADDGVDPRALLISVVGTAPESAHVDVGVQLAEDVGITVTGSHDGEAGGPLGRPAQLHPITMVQELVKRLIQAAIRPPNTSRICERRSGQFFWNSRDF